MVATRRRSEERGYLRQPAIHDDTVVLVGEDDLWAVPITGGMARRLTANPGVAAFPVLSPDGRWLAFAGRDEGPTEVFVMPSAGGAARRLTFLGSAVRPLAFTPKGDAIVFQSSHGRPFAHEYHLHAVPLAGGPTRELPYGPAREIAWQPGGPGIVLGINSGDPARWKRYRGGTAGQLWIDRRGKGRFAPLLDLPGNLAAPMWLGGRVFFLADHEGHGNLYSCRPDGTDVRRHTHHEDFYVRFPATDGRRIVYHLGADLWVYDLAADRTRLLEVELRSTRSGRSRRFVEAHEWLESADLHPQGQALAAVVRGGAFTMPLWEGVPRRHGPVSTARHRCARWLADGRRVGLVSDAEGEEQLVVVDTSGQGRPRRVRGDFGRILTLDPSPVDADRLALSNHRQELWLVDLRSGRARRLARNEHQRLLGIAWSPDGRWLAYGWPASRNACGLRLHDVARRRTHDLTRPEFVDYAPVFDPEGRYLYFLSRRVFDPVYDAHYFDLGFPRGARAYLLTLAKDTPSPFAPATLPARAPGAPAKRSEAPPADKRQRQPVRVDLDGIADRVVALPMPEARYVGIAAAAGRVLVSSLPVEGSLHSSWHDSGPPPAKAKLEVLELERGKPETLIDGITSFDLSLDAKTLLVRMRNRLRVLPATVKAKDLSSEAQASRETGWIDVGRLRVEVLPGAEWRQMFREAWRLQRDQFWTPDMAQVDWQRVHDRYLPLVERVATRTEFSDLMWELQGELGTSHCYELGGDYAPQPGYHQGFLGADLELDRRSGRWRIARIPVGDAWEAGAGSPLRAPGTGITDGDLLLAVNGIAVGPQRSPAECLVHQALRDVRLTVQRGRGRPREVAVRTLASEQLLRYRDWVERNRAFVHDKSRGRAGYVHVPDMGPRGYSEFHRYYKQEVDRDGLIVDVRWNGGGHVSQLLLEKLARRRIAWDLPRWHAAEPYPSDAPMGPLVALTNEFAGSDGDIFCHAFKLMRLGPLIGKRTWGGVIGIWPRHSLVDGTVTTQPEFGNWFEDVGFGVENYGTDPDIVVEISPQDHAAGRDTQLERALAEVLRLVEAQPARRPPKTVAPHRRPPRLP